MSRAPVVLVVSEHEWASRSLDTVLAPRGYAIVRAYNGAQAVERSAAHRPDVVFIERSLPDTNGPALCRRLREEECVSAATPIILTTSGPITREQRIEGLEAGAWETITLPVDAQELLLRLERYTRAKMEADIAAERARTDPETGLYNEPGVMQRTYELLASGERYGRPVACVIYEPSERDDMNIREFLTSVVDLLRKTTRRSDVVGRIGPARFVVITPDTSPEGAEILAERLTVASRGGRLDARTGAFGVPDAKTAKIDPRELVDRAIGASDNGSARWH